MSVSLRNFVKIDIGYIDNTTASGTREVAVLLDIGLNDTGGEVISSGIITNVDDLHATKDSVLYKYVKCFFDNGGKKLYYVNKASSVQKTNEEWLKEQILLLPNEYIMIASTCDELTLRNVALYLESQEKFKGINEKILVSSFSSYDMEITPGTPAIPAVGEVANPQPTSSTFSAGTYYTILDDEEYTPGHLVNADGEKYILATVFDADIASDDGYIIVTNEGQDAIPGVMFKDNKPSSSMTNYVLKYGEKGIEMTILAYFTKINVYGSKSIEDYAFTKEVLYNDTFINSLVDDDSIVEQIKNDHYNCEVELIDTIRNIGGDNVNAKDLVNHFVKILLSQTLTSRLVQVLANKVRYNQTGLSKLIGTIVTELKAYKNFGYLTTDKVWTLDDWYVHDGKYLIISQNEPLTLGYKFRILPFDSLDPEQKAQHMLPPIYLVIADSYSIREIEITGQVY